MSLTPFLYDFALDGVPSSPDFTIEVSLTPSTATTIGKLADVALHFAGGPLAHLRLDGFVVWRRGTRWPGPRVTFPGHPRRSTIEVSDVYPMTDELGPGVPVTSLLCDHILAAYHAAVADLAQRSEVR